MDKKVIFSVAGSGKTRTIIDSLDETKLTLIITYTNANYENIRLRVIKKFGYWPKNITLTTYFSFLYSFCSLPFLQSALGLSGVTFSQKADFYIKKDNKRHYLNKFNKAYSNRLAKLLLETSLVVKVCKRLSKYYECLCIDEIQDFAANDFNFLKELFKSEMSILCVGDFYQHTFDTGNDGPVNKNLYKDYQKYQSHFLKSGLLVDTTSLNKSWRCPQEVCDFVTDKLGITINSKRDSTGSVETVLDKNKLKILFEDDRIVKLFWEKSYQYSCHSNNWGKSKGLDHYQDVCIVLTNVASKALVNNKMSELSETTKSKLYVACTRASRNLYLVPDDLFKDFYKEIV